MQKVVLATRNLGKIKEFERILAEHANGIEVLGLADFPDMPDVEETGNSFEENSLLKASSVAHFTNLPAIADDSGLCVDALGGDPGIFSARWAGHHGDDAANTAKVLDQLRDIPDSERGAHFTCVAALYLPDGRSHCEEAHFDGWILRSPIGEHGFGYDPIFRPEGHQLSSAQMSAEEKDAISHRGKALKVLLQKLNERAG